MAPEISGVMIALGNKIAHDGAGEPADDVHGGNIACAGYPGNSTRDMIKRHGKDREQLSASPVRPRRDGKAASVMRNLLMKSLYCSIVKNAGGVVNCARLTFWRVRDTIRIEKTERQERKMQLRRMLGIQPGLTAIVGGGGKTTLYMRWRASFLRRRV